MIIRFKKSEYGQCVGSIELSDEAMMYLIPIKLEGGVEAIHIHISRQHIHPLDVTTVTNQRYSLEPADYNFKEFSWSIDKFDGEAVNGEFYLIYLN